MAAAPRGAAAGRGGIGAVIGLPPQRTRPRRTTGASVGLPATRSRHRGSRSARSPATSIGDGSSVSPLQSRSRVVQRGRVAGLTAPAAAVLCAAPTFAGGLLDAVIFRASRLAVRNRFRRGIDLAGRSASRPGPGLCRHHPAAGIRRLRARRPAVPAAGQQRRLHGARGVGPRQHARQLGAAALHRDVPRGCPGPGAVAARTVPIAAETGAATPHAL